MAKSAKPTEAQLLSVVASAQYMAWAHEVIKGYIDDVEALNLITKAFIEYCIQGIKMIVGILSDQEIYFWWLTERSARFL